MKPNRVLVVITLTVLASMALPVLATGTVAAQQTNTNTTATATPTPTPTPTGGTTAGDVCPNPQRPQMSQSRLYAPQRTITAGEAGRIDGGFLLESGLTCPVKTRVTLRVPSGMTISGGSDWRSAGAGLVSTTFTVRPGGGIKDLSANVFSDQTGQRRVTGDVEYYPVGHPELSNEIDGITMTFNVEEPNPAPQEEQQSTPQSTPAPPGPGPIERLISAINGSPVFVIGGIAALAIVAIIFVSPKFEIGISK
jgi:hypothetical protein